MYLENIRIVGNLTNFDQTGMKIEGYGIGSWNNTIIHPVIGGCKIGIDLFGKAGANVNAVGIFGGVIVGKAGTREGSIGIRHQIGDTIGLYHTDIESFENAISLATASSLTLCNGIRIESCGTAIAIVSGSNNHRFIGGSISNVNTVVSNSGSGTRFARIVGYISETRGDASVSHATTIAHGLATTPSIITLISESTSPRIFSVTSKDASNFTVGIWNTSGSTISGTRAYWYAEV